MTNASMVMPTRRVEMWFGGTTQQRRATVAFRIILAIPQFIVLWFLFIAGFFVLVIGWFGALFTGRLPEFARTYLGGVIRWEIRVNAYMFLLTDSYPPFSLEDVDYPVRTILPGGGPLNRVSVFFRIILAIPASVFSQIVLYGLTAPLLFVMWIVVLVTGTMPAALYDAYAALLRYLARYHSWFTMITSEYAWGMLGDFVPPPQAAVPPPVGGVAGTAPYGAPQTPMPQAPPARRRRLRHSRRHSRSRTPRPASRWPRHRRMAGRPRRRPSIRRRSPHHRPEQLARPAPCLRPPRGSAHPWRHRLIRCPPGGFSSFGVRPGRG